MTIYNLVIKLLKNIPQTRNSDKLLFTEVLRSLGAVKSVNWFGEREAVLLDSLTSGDLPSYESVRRSRQKAQEKYPELGATDSKVIALRKQKEQSKGTFIYREQV